MKTTQHRWIVLRRFCICDVDRNTFSPYKTYNNKSTYNNNINQLLQYNNKIQVVITCTFIIILNKIYCITHVTLNIGLQNQHLFYFRKIDQNKLKIIYLNYIHITPMYNIYKSYNKQPSYRIEDPGYCTSLLPNWTQSK